MTILPDSSTLLAFSTTCLVLTITPGPDMTLFLGRTLAGGRRAGLAAYCGAATGSLVHTTLAALGLSALLAASPSAFLVLKVVGAAYLVYLAFDAIRNGSRLAVETVPGRRSASLAANWLTGLGINLTNPKIVLFFVTFLPQFVQAGDANAAGRLLFLGVYFVVFATPVCIAMILAADALAETLKRRPTITRLLDCLFAGVFSAFAVRILTTQAR